MRLERVAAMRWGRPYSLRLDDLELLESIPACILPCRESIGVASMNNSGGCARAGELDVPCEEQAISIRSQHAIILELGSKIASPGPLLGGRALGGDCF